MRSGFAVRAAGIALSLLLSALFIPRADAQTPVAERPPAIFYVDRAEGAVGYCIGPECSVEVAQRNCYLFRCEDPVPLSICTEWGWGCLVEGRTADGEVIFAMSCGDPTYNHALDSAERTIREQLDGQATTTVIKSWYFDPIVTSTTCDYWRNAKYTIDRIFRTPALAARYRDARRRGAGRYDALIESIVSEPTLSIEPLTPCSAEALTYMNRQYPE